MLQSAIQTQNQLIRQSTRSVYRSFNRNGRPRLQACSACSHFHFSTTISRKNRDDASSSSSSPMRPKVVDNRSATRYNTQIQQKTPSETSASQQSSSTVAPTSSNPSSNHSDDVQAKEAITLAHILAESIKASGPLSVSTYMTTSLLDPSYGYYASSKDGSTDGTGRDVLGSRGDFITSPEISQVFGELLAIYFVSRWQANEMPEKTRLIELGPGRGTLLSDMVRTFSVFPSLLNSISKIHLVETSTGLMQLQHDALTKVLEKAGKRLVGPTEEGEPSAQKSENEIEVEWFPRVEGVPIENDSYTMLVAHEFFDALPTHIFEKTRDDFREVLVDIKREKQGQSGVTTFKPSEMSFSSQSSSSSPSPKPEFQYVLSPSPTPWSRLLASRSPRFKHLKEGQRVEISPESWAVSRRIGELISGRLSKPNPLSPQDYEALSGSEKDELKRKEEKRLGMETKGGCALIVDYGDEKAFGGSFRAFKHHQIVDPLENPGTADLTSNVDFLHLKSAIQTTEARSLPLMFQSHFLQALGLEPRIEALLKGADSEERKRDLQSSAKRLIDPTGMGAQYKVLGLEAPRRKAGESHQVEERGHGETNGNEKIYPFEM